MPGYNCINCGKPMERGLYCTRACREQHIWSKDGRLQAIWVQMVLDCGAAIQKYVEDDECTDVT